MATEPEPRRAPEPTAEPHSRTVVPIGVGPASRQWNLERVARDASGEDAVRGAAPSGELPVDFDVLVRESFGELVGAR